MNCFGVGCDDEDDATYRASGLVGDDEMTL
jgi:hypothetical protein